jgi:hypothetical protein
LTEIWEIFANVAGIQVKAGLMIEGFLYAGLTKTAALSFQLKLKTWKQ